MAEEEVWRPGSFTKNFSWGDDQAGLRELHAVIKAGFADTLEDVPRSVFKERVANIRRPDLIPMNFFLFNRQIGGEDYILADELVFQTLSSDHNPAFDRLALFAFVFSYAGKFRRGNKDQRRPALWATSYITERVNSVFGYDATRISTNDIEDFIKGDPRYIAKTAKKLSSNLNYLLHIGGIENFGQQIVTRWWVDCLFLALDRLVEDANVNGKNSKRPSVEHLLSSSKFSQITGGKNLEKDMATKHLLRLYTKLGGRERFFDDIIIAKTKNEIPDAMQVAPNNPQPRGAIHPTNYRILKSIPPRCSQLAEQVGFEIISPGQMDELNIEEFAKQRTSAALVMLNDRKIAPTMTIDELLEITRGR